MATYYLSACHDCKEQVMWDKCPREQGEKWHKEYTNTFHKGHDTQFDSDYNDEFYDKIFKYKDLGVCDMDEVIEKKENKHLESEQHLLNLTTLELIKMIQDLKDEVHKLQGVALYWEGQASYWENQYHNKKWRL